MSQEEPLEPSQMTTYQRQAIEEQLTQFIIRLMVQEEIATLLEIMEVSIKCLNHASTENWEP